MSVVYDNWFVRVAGESYGPYTHALMARFVAEGRVTAATEISADPSQGWYPASSYPQYAQWLAGSANPANAPAQPLQAVQTQASAAPMTRHLVMAELRGGGAMDFLRVVQGYAQCTRIGDAVWLVDGAGDTNALTQALVRALGGTDRLFVVDITGQPTGQFGFRDASRSA